MLFRLLTQLLEYLSLSTKLCLGGRDFLPNPTKLGVVGSTSNVGCLPAQHLVLFRFLSSPNLQVFRLHLDGVSGLLEFSTVVGVGRHDCLMWLLVLLLISIS